MHWPDRHDWMNWGGEYDTIRGVRKSFESQLVLDGVDLDIPERSVVSIIGPSGSGKSTLLRTIDFLETANAGTIDFGEGPVSLTSTKPKDIASVRAKIGFVFQNYNLFLNRTVLDNVAIGLIHAKGKGRKEAVRIAYDELDRVGMGRIRGPISEQTVRWSAATRGHCARGRHGSRTVGVG